MVGFNGWVTEFSDQFTSNWNEETVYGRMDPLATFQNTQREISLSFDVVAESHTTALQNLSDINRLIQFLYPVYTTSARGIQNTLKAGPLIGLEWTNLINNSSTPGRLVGYLRGLNYNPDMGEGGFLAGGNDTTTVADVTDIGGVTKVFDRSEPNGYAEFRDPTKDHSVTTTTQKRAYIPKKVNISFSFTVLHTHLMGWYKTEDNKFVFGDPTANGKFPNSSFITNMEKTEVWTETMNGEVISERTEVTQEQTNQSLVLGSTE